MCNSIDIVTILKYKIDIYGSKMKQIETFCDERNNDFCSYCGGFPDTRDHVPSKILLDSPYPENLPVVPCCYKCNNDLSIDEEYIACIINFMEEKSTNINGKNNEKIKSILERKEKLYSQLSYLMNNFTNQQIIEKDRKRFNNVIIKLAKGHYKYEYGELIIEMPDAIEIKFIEYMTRDEKHNFFNSYYQKLFPEIGSRQFIDIIENKCFGWVKVQENVYEYLIFNNGINQFVRILIRNFIAIEVKWN
jgi:hypothetical protein